MHKLNELRQKGAKEYKVGPNSNIETLCEMMSNSADIESRTYKANFRGTTFYVYPGNKKNDALRSYCEAMIANDDKKSTLHHLREVQEDAYFGEGFDGMFASVVVEKIVNQYMEEVYKISPIALLNAHNHKGSNEYVNMRIKELLDANAAAYMSGAERIPLTFQNIEKLKEFGTYIKNMTNSEGKKLIKSQIVNARCNHTEKAFLKKLTNDLTGGEKQHLFARSALPMYMLAKKHNDKAAMDAIAVSVSPVAVMKQFGLDHYDVMDTSKKVEATLLLHHAIDTMMEGKNTFQPIRPDHVFDFNSLLTYVDKQCHGKYTPEQLNTQRTENDIRFLDYMRKNPEAFADLDLDGYKMVNRLAKKHDDPKNPQYADLGKKAAAECARLSKLENGGKGPNG